MRQLGSFPGGLVLDGQKNRSTHLAIRQAPPVSYTHLTLPTIYSV